MFASAKSKLDAAGPGADANTVMDALHSATTLRALLVSGLSSGLRNDAADKALAMRQRCAASTCPSPASAATCPPAQQLAWLPGCADALLFAMPPQ